MYLSILLTLYDLTFNDINKNNCHFPENKAIGVMKPGHCFTIEPMINEGGWRDEQWPDHWTAVTADGSRSAQVLYKDR